jgi:hypothetical protein
MLPWATDDKVDLQFSVCIFGQEQRRRHKENTGKRPSGILTLVPYFVKGFVVCPEDRNQHAYELRQGFHSRT